MPALVGPTPGMKAPVIAPKGPTTAPKVGGTPAAVPKPSIVKTPTSPAGKVAAAKATGTSSGLEPLNNTSPASLSNLAASAASKIYKPIMANYNNQLNSANGLAQKRTADVNAFGQWYTQQQQALAAEEGTRQTNLQNLLGQLGSSTATTPQNGIQSSIGNNLSNPTGGQQQAAAVGDNAASSGILSTQALGNANETNSSQNALTALGGAYQQNMMSTISSDLTKTDTSIEDAQSKAYTDEGTDASKIDTNLTSYLNDQNKNVVSQNKNVITADYDQQQADTKALNSIVATATANGQWTPALTAQYNAISARLTGVKPTATNGPTGLTTKGEANVISQEKVNQNAYENVTKRLAVAATNTKTKDSFILGQIKNNIASAEAGAKVTVSNAEAKYYAAKTGQSVADAKADLVKAYAYAQHYGGGTAGTTSTAVPLTTNEADSALSKASGYQAALAQKNLSNSALRAFVTQNYGTGGSLTSSLMWAAFDQHAYGALTPRTYQMLINNGIPKSALVNYKVASPKVK